MNAAMFSALAEPVRLTIVELLRDGPMAVGEIADRLALRQPQTSKHLRVLNDTGWVEVEPIANRRIYRLRREQIIELDRWLDSFRRVWEDRFDRLDEYLQDMKQDRTDMH